MRRLLCVLASMMFVVQLTCMFGCSAVGESRQEQRETVALSTTVPATAEDVRLIGRTCEDDGVVWLPQSGSAIEFKANGTRVEVEVVGDAAVGNKPDRRPRFAVLVDDKVVVDDTLDEPSRTVEVWNAKSASTAVVKVIHLSEAQYGAIGVRSITAESGNADPVEPTSAHDLCIEFVGDSITCAYGVEAANSEEPFSTQTEDFMDSYAYLAAQALDADYSTVGYSGYGIVSGWSDDGSKNAKMLVPPLYDLVATGYERQWDFSAHPCDVVVVNLGTNDFTYTGTDEDRMREFQAGYEAFLAQIRMRNPQAHIVCTLGAMGGQELYPYVERAVSNFREQTGDERVVCYATDPIDVDRDGSGTRGHPNRISQQRCADALADVIRKTLGL